MRALKGLSAVSGGGGIFWTIALRISLIPIPSYTTDLSLQLHIDNMGSKKKWDTVQTFAEQWIASLQSRPTTYENGSELLRLYTSSIM